MGGVFDALSVAQIVDRAGTTKINAVALEARLHERLNDLWESHRIVLGSPQAGAGSIFLRRCHNGSFSSVS